MNVNDQRIIQDIQRVQNAAAVLVCHDIQINRVAIQEGIDDRCVIVTDTDPRKSGIVLDYLHRPQPTAFPGATLYMAEWLNIQLWWYVGNSEQAGIPA